MIMGKCIEEVFTERRIIIILDNKVGIMNEVWESIFINKYLVIVV